MAQNTSVTLYFIAGAVPTAADEARALLIPGIVKFRNVSEVNTNEIETSDFATAADGVTIPTAYAAVARVSAEEPLSLEIVPNNPTADFSDTEHLDLRAIARFSDGSATDVTTLCAWTSATPAKATIGAATGIVTPLEVGTTVITATYNFAAPGEIGVVYATGAFTFVTPPDVDDTFVIGDITYTWKAAPAATASATAVQVKVGTTAAIAASNAAKAINRSAGGAGSIYSSDAPVNGKVSAAIAPAFPLIINLTAKHPGTAGNAYATTQTGDEATFGGTVLSAGANATAPVTDTTTVTVAA